MSLNLEQLMDKKHLPGDRDNKIKLSVVQKLLLKKYSYWIQDVNYRGKNLFDLPLFDEPMVMVKVCVGHIPEKGYCMGLIPYPENKSIKETIAIIGVEIKKLRKQFKTEERKHK